MHRRWRWATTVCSCTAADGYWSATTFAGNPTNAWDVFFGFGNAFTFNKTNDGYVCAVRGGL